MIRKDLLDLQYYLDRLSKFMQESYGIDKQVETFQTLLKQINEYYDRYFEELNFFKYDEYEEGSELLNMIGKVFNCERSFTLPIYDVNNPLTIIGYESVDLNNDEYLMYIKTQVIKQNFDGGRETLQKLYSTYINGQNHPGILEDFYILYTTPANARCEIRWNAENPSENLRKLFENGYLTIESMGIMYTRSIENFNKFAYFEIQYADLVKVEPSPFDPTNYYKISATQPTSTWDSSKIYAKLVNGRYVILDEEPVNWADIYQNCVILEQGSAGDVWAADTYYSITPENDYNKFAQDKYIRISTQPADWGTGKYYSISAAAATPTAWDPTKTYGSNDSGNWIIIANEPVNWVAGVYSGKGILTITEVVSGTPFMPNTYFRKEELGGILI